ncbi:unnamed protein product, partial [marine sediment metagenome]
APRGIASILYIFIVLESESLPGLQLIYSVVMITVLFSIFAHGITASPLSNRYGSGIEAVDKKQILTPETEDVPEMPLRNSDQPQIKT